MSLLHATKQLREAICATLRMQVLFDQGYSAMDIITTMFRVVRNYDLPEFVKLEYIKVRGILRFRDMIAHTVSCLPPAHDGILRFRDMIAKPHAG
jgi:Replication factor C C-terminal domain